MENGVGALVVGQKALSSFVASIGPSVQRALDLSSRHYLLCQKYQAAPGSGLETYGIQDTSGHGTKVIDLRGTELDAVRMVSSRQQDILTTLSFDWFRANTRLRFVGAQFAVFSGRRTSTALNEDARQLFRLEWQGRSDDGKFEAAVAGHPHWQVDATPSSAVPPPGPLATANLADLMHSERPTLKTWMTHIHLPSAANDWSVGAGWSGDPNDCAAHTSSPESLDSLSTWVLSAARYLKHQIGAAVAQ